MEIATKNSWKTLPMLQPKKVAISLSLDMKQFNTLRLGVVPAQMEDKWFVYFHNQYIHFHRSWTGYEIYRAKLISDENTYYIDEFWVESNPDRYQMPDEQRAIADFKFHIEYLSNRTINNPVKNAIWGFIVGDALGVPVEFKSRAYLKQNPVSDMTGFGTHGQPVGTWSDDSSLTLCLADELTKGLDFQNIGTSFVRWFDENHWTARGTVFDIGNSTREAILSIKKGVKAISAGSLTENSNGNGALMRILPLLFEVQKIQDSTERYELIKKVSSITHGHIRSVLACFYYLELASFLSADIKSPVPDAYKAANRSLLQLVQKLKIHPKEIALFDRITQGNLASLPESSIHSSGYVIHTLEASIWCLLTSKSYQEAVLKAVNLGDDTDTTAAVTGGLAGLYYGFNSIPKEWMSPIARKNDIDDLIKRFSDQYNIAYA